MFWGDEYLEIVGVEGDIVKLAVRAMGLKDKFLFEFRSDELGGLCRSVQIGAIYTKLQFKGSAIIG